MSTSNASLAAEDMLRWLRLTSDNWRSLLNTHPELLTMPCDIMGVHTVAELLQHIVAVELRYAEQLSGLPPTDYAHIAFDTVDAIYATHDRAVAMYARLLASEIDWDERIEFITRSMGPARSTRRAVLFHGMLHAIRHYAQLATLVRQHGVKPGWGMDYLMLDLEPITPA